jgi:hypothetical protein
MLAVIFRCFCVRGFGAIIFDQAFSLEHSFSSANLLSGGVSGEFLSRARNAALDAGKVLGNHARCKINSTSNCFAQTLRLK